MLASGLGANSTETANVARVLPTSLALLAICSHGAGSVVSFRSKIAVLGIVSGQLACHVSRVEPVAVCN